jgi:hypothetical protein
MANDIHPYLVKLEDFIGEGQLITSSDTLLAIFMIDGWELGLREVFKIGVSVGDSVGVREVWLVGLAGRLMIGICNGIPEDIVEGLYFRDVVGLRVGCNIGLIVRYPMVGKTLGL